ncbi:polysaccharide biosynthesis protein [Thermoleophilum album]|uniref:polysaccharide biosynthesis protein n=1 Tax=Thermoleophilum album TaxID=29539 RepID=UPI00237C7640|nr:nucleoside-diphosphate sugar epimerase/dehydratase [Thermoleophilum album]WDT93713.1 polysaccharide biosynthesis protein [Thermoleophilum album]
MNGDTHKRARTSGQLLALLAGPRVRRIGQLAVDGALVALAWWLAFVLRFDNGIPPRYRDLLLATLPLVVALKVVVLALFGAYSKLWRYVDQRDFNSLVRAVVVGSVAVIAATFVLAPGRVDPPRGVIALDLLLTLALLGGARFLVRALVVERPLRGPLFERAAREVLIVGAGNGGQQVAAELRRNPQLASAPIGFVDDDPRKRGMRIAGLKVLGSTDDLPRILDDTKPDEVIIAIPSAPGLLRQKVVTACRERQIPVRTLPTTFELLSGGIELVRQAREVRVEDVLGREPVRMEIDRVGAYLRGRVVLVTGAGGSIGSELCRQIARVGPRMLVLVDNAETALFEIRRELEQERHFARLAAVLADCRDATRMREVFLEHRPNVVFHAAAYKHVPLMEENPVEAIRNNAVATRIVAAAAGSAGADRFVLVSTDKAVRPQTVMGASKALAEWAVEAAQSRYPGTRYAAVRFGNVLGSSGSVVPIFRRQIAKGGPVTVTDPRMTRYFMTIPEAVQLIIRSGDLARGGEIFVLEMGEPVPIIELARNMIRLAGYEPGVDIAIEIVGPRPGEKLHEELFNPDETPRPTAAEKIVCAARAPIDPAWVDAVFARIEELAYTGSSGDVAAAVAELAAERWASRGDSSDAQSEPRPAEGKATSL